MTPADRYAAIARAAAQSILRKPPFATAPRAPGLFDRVSTDLGHAIEAVVRWFVRLYRAVIGHPVSSAAHAAFGSSSDLVLIVLGVAVVAVLCALWVRRSRPAGGHARVGADASRRRRADAFLARAAAARATGDLDLALRLRFEAGLEHLEARGVLPDRTTLTTATIAAEVRSSTFDGLASTHAVVAYAGVPASEGDVATAFERWPDVDFEARRVGAAPT